jgi:hypothetical protein
VFRWRDRYAVPAIVSLIVARFLLAPLEWALIPSRLLHSPQAQLLHDALLLALFVWLFTIALNIWAHWRFPAVTRFRPNQSRLKRRVPWRMRR